MLNWRTQFHVFQEDIAPYENDFQSFELNKDSELDIENANHLNMSTNNYFDTKDFIFNNNIKTLKKIKIWNEMREMNIVCDSLIFHRKFKQNLYPLDIQDLNYTNIIYSYLKRYFPNEQTSYHFAL